MRDWQMAIGSVIGVDDGTGAHQRVDVSGLAGERFTKVIRSQPFGFSSVPPAGSRGLLLLGGANREVAALIGAEHGDHRPTGMVAGATAIYGAQGEIISLVGTEIRIKAATIVLDGTVKLGGSGANKQVALLGSVDSDGDTIQSAVATKVYAL